MNFEQDLNPKQYLACTSKAKHLRIIAGAGTGKTRTLTYRLAYLIKSGIKPSDIVAITFTNKVANEMKSRVSKILQDDGFKADGHPIISTFHGFCYRFLRKEITALPNHSQNFTILDDTDQKNIYKDIFSTMIKGNSKAFVSSVVSKISSLKTDGKFLEDVTEDDVPDNSSFTYKELIYVYGKYQRLLLKQNLVDFDDLLMFTYKIMKENKEIRKYWRNRFKAILVDEFQDTNYLQYEIVRLFLGEDSSLTVVGDPDQTIYTWRGAKNDIIKNRLERDFPDLESVILDDNYRSTQEILDTANKLIQCNKNRVKKDLNAASKIQGKKVEYYLAFDQDKEAYHIANTISKLVSEQDVKYKDIAVIYRANYLSNKIEKQMTSFRIPYEIYGGLKFYERAEIKDALSYLRLAITPDDISFKRILQAPSKGVGEVTLNKASELAANYDCTLFDVFYLHSDELRLPNNTKLALKRFFDAYKSFKTLLDSHEDNFKLITGIRTYLNDTGFLNYVKAEDIKKENKYAFTASTATSKVDNVNELLHDIQGFLEKDQLNMDGELIPNTLSEFLISVALQSDQDTMNDTDQVSLMTGHVSKGLEFPYVFVTGLNENIFPSSHAIMSADPFEKIEEERRLCYVCMTRAQKELYLSSFSGFDYFSKEQFVPSRFLKEAGFTRNAEKQSYVPTEREAYTGSHKMKNINASKMKAKQFATASTSRVNISQNKDSYQVGDKVIHTSFGVGEVISVENNKILVTFPEAGLKSLVIGFPTFRKMREDEA